MPHSLTDLRASGFPQKPGNLFFGKRFFKSVFSSKKEFHSLFVGPVYRQQRPRQESRPTLILFFLQAA